MSFRSPKGVLWKHLPIEVVDVVVDVVDVVVGSVVIFVVAGSAVVTIGVVVVVDSEASKMKLRI